MIMDGIYYVPDGTKDLIELLESFDALHERQIAAYFMKRYDGWSIERVRGLLKSLVDIRAIRIKDGYVAIKESTQVNKNRVLAFWILLKYMDKDTIFDVARYPGEIVFTSGDEVYEIVVADDDFPRKVAFLQRRYKGYENTKLDIAVKDIIAEIDTEAFPDEDVCFTVYEERKIAPKLTKHEYKADVEQEDSEEGGEVVEQEDRETE